MHPHHRCCFLGFDMTGAPPRERMTKAERKPSQLDIERRLCRSSASHWLRLAAKMPSLFPHRSSNAQGHPLLSPKHTEHGSYCTPVPYPATRR